MPDVPEHERIRRRMEKLRNQIDQDMVRVRENVHQMFDWKQYLTRYPVALVSAALVAGYILVPRRKAPLKVVLDERTRKELLAQFSQQAKTGKAQVPPVDEPTPSFFRQMTTLATNMAVRAAMTYVGQHVGKYVGDQIAMRSQEMGINTPPAPGSAFSESTAGVHGSKVANAVASDRNPVLAVFADETPQEAIS